MEILMRKSITICSSAAFYEKANQVKAELEAMGFTVLIPDMALEMKTKNDYVVEHYKTWYEDDGDYHKKQALMRGHFDKVAEGDITLVLNYTKNGQENYVGGNVLMEIALAFYANKPIYLLNEFPEYSPLIEEIKGVGSIPLHGDINTLKELLA